MFARVTAPFCSCSRHSKVISNSYLSVNFAGLFITLTPRSETIDTMRVVERCSEMIGDDERVQLETGQGVWWKI